MQPFNYKFIVVTAFYVGIWFLLSFIPHQKLIIDIFIRGGLIVISTFIFLILFPASEDIKRIISKLFQKLNIH